MSGSFAIRRLRSRDSRRARNKTMVLDGVGFITNVRGRYGFAYCPDLGEEIFFNRLAVHASLRPKDAVDDFDADLARIFCRGDEVGFDLHLNPELDGQNKAKWIATHHSLSTFLRADRSHRLKSFGKVFSLSVRSGYIQVTGEKGNHDVYFNTGALYPQTSMHIQSILRSGDYVSFVAEPEKRWPYWRAISVELVVMYRARRPARRAASNERESSISGISPLIKDTDVEKLSNLEVGKVSNDSDRQRDKNALVAGRDRSRSRSPCNRPVDHGGRRQRRNSATERHLYNNTYPEQLKQGFLGKPDRYDVNLNNDDDDIILEYDSSVEASGSVPRIGGSSTEQQERPNSTLTIEEVHDDAHSCSSRSSERTVSPEDDTGRFKMDRAAMRQRTERERNELDYRKGPLINYSSDVE